LYKIIFPANVVKVRLCNLNAVGCTPFAFVSESSHRIFAFITPFTGSISHVSPAAAFSGTKSSQSHVPLLHTHAEAASANNKKPLALVRIIVPPFAVEPRRGGGGEFSIIAHTKANAKMNRPMRVVLRLKKVVVPARDCRCRILGYIFFSSTFLSSPTLSAVGDGDDDDDAKLLISIIRRTKTSGWRKKKKEFPSLSLEFPPLSHDTHTKTLKASPPLVCANNSSFSSGATRVQQTDRQTDGQTNKRRYRERQLDIKVRYRF
jgi:hypothetical protein